MTKRTVTPEELTAPVVAYEDARRDVLGAFAPLAPVDVSLADGLGLVVAEEVASPLDVPGFESSAMDGYAARSEDLRGASPQSPVVLPVVGDRPAGAEPGDAVESGTVVKIMTGGPIPPGADTIVPWEDTEPGEGSVAIMVAQPPGKHVRPRGEDLRTGDTVVVRGVVLRPVHLGVLASIGRTTVRAHPRARVAILSTGDEVVAPGATLRAGQVYDANAAMLAASCVDAGAVVIATGHVRDDPAAVSEWIEAHADRADMIVTSGGASVGEHDWLREVLARDGELRMWRVAIKPGKPIAFGRVAGTPVLALPGNPGSAFVGMHVFVGPAIRAMAARAPEHAFRTARLADAVKGSPSRTLFARVRLDGDVAVPLPAQSSVVLSNLIPAEGFAIVPPGGLPSGAEVRVELIGRWHDS